MRFITATIQGRQLIKTLRYIHWKLVRFDSKIYISINSKGEKIFDRNQFEIRSIRFYSTSRVKDQKSQKSTYINYALEYFEFSKY